MEKLKHLEYIDTDESSSKDQNKHSAGPLADNETTNPKRKTSKSYRYNPIKTRNTRTD